MRAVATGPGSPIRARSANGPAPLPSSVIKRLTKDEAVIFNELPLLFVVPAKAGIQGCKAAAVALLKPGAGFWTPACAAGRAHLWQSGAAAEVASPSPPLGGGEGFLTGPVRCVHALV